MVSKNRKLPVKDVNETLQLRGMLKKAKGGKIGDIIKKETSTQRARNYSERATRIAGMSSEDMARQHIDSAFENGDLTDEEYETALGQLEYNMSHREPIKKAKGGKVNKVASALAHVKSMMEEGWDAKDSLRETRKKFSMNDLENDHFEAGLDDLEYNDPFQKPIKKAEGGLAELRKAVNRGNTTAKGRSRTSALVRKPRKGTAGVLEDADSSLGSTGNRLADAAQRLAEGGKVGVAALALRQLAQKFESALQMEDQAGARRIARQMELMEPGSSQSALQSIQRPIDRVTSDKLATFAKGGKVGSMVGKFIKDKDGYVYKVHHELPKRNQLSAHDMNQDPFVFDKDEVREVPKPKDWDETGWDEDNF